jgi:cyclic beta-1,2-glucan synthetase
MAELKRNNRAMALLEMLNPVNHTRTPEEVARYQVEPYVAAADVYGSDPHVGRGGWTWYTGSAAWMFRVAVESLLGFELRDGATLRLKPCIPDAWPEYRLWYRLPDGKTQYEIVVQNPSGIAHTVVQVSLDGEEMAVAEGAALIPLRMDGSQHEVYLRLGAR